jgi:hypothetical protein
MWPSLERREYRPNGGERCSGYILMWYSWFNEKDRADNTDISKIPRKSRDMAVLMLKKERKRIRDKCAVSFCNFYPSIAVA